MKVLEGKEVRRAFIAYLTTHEVGRWDDFVAIYQKLLKEKFGGDHSKLGLWNPNVVSFNLNWLVQRGWIVETGSAFSLNLRT